MSSRGSFGSYGDTTYNSYQSGGQSGSARDSSNEFQRLTTAVGNNIQKITEKVAQMQRMVGQIGTPKDTPELRDELHKVQHYSNQLAKDTNKYIKELSSLPPPSGQSELRQRKMLKDRLTNDFTTVLNNFQTAQRNAAEKEKESMQRAKKQSNYDPFMDEKKGDDQLVNFGVGHTQPQATLQMEEDVDLQLMQEREGAIRQLESDIMDVNQIFKDLGMMVHEQGEYVDSIEAHVDTAEMQVESGVTELQKAGEYQRKARRKKCIIIIIVLVVLGIIATIIGVTVSRHT